MNTKERTPEEEIVYLTDKLKKKTEALIITQNNEWETQRLYNNLKDEFENQVKIQVALSTQKYSEQYMNFVDKLTDLIKELKTK